MKPYHNREELAIRVLNNLVAKPKKLSLAKLVFISKLYKE